MCVFVWGHHKHLLMPVFITYYLPAIYDGFYLSMIYIPWGIKIIPQIQGGMSLLKFQTFFNHVLTFSGKFLYFVRTQLKVSLIGQLN